MPSAGQVVAQDQRRKDKHVEAEPDPRKLDIFWVQISQDNVIHFLKITSQRSFEREILNKTAKAEYHKRMCST